MLEISKTATKFKKEYMLATFRRSLYRATCGHKLFACLQKLFSYLQSFRMVEKMHRVCINKGCRESRDM